MASALKVRLWQFAVKPAFVGKINLLGHQPIKRQRHLGRDLVGLICDRQVRLRERSGCGKENGENCGMVDAMRRVSDFS